MPGQHSQTTLCLFRGVCVTRCNLPPALLAEWLGSFMYHCGTAGVEWTPNKGQHRQWTLGKNILLLLWLGFKLAPFWSQVWRSTYWAIPTLRFYVTGGLYLPFLYWQIVSTFTDKLYLPFLYWHARWESVCRGFRSLLLGRLLYESRDERHRTQGMHTRQVQEALSTTWDRCSADSFGWSSTILTWCTLSLSDFDPENLKTFTPVPTIQYILSLIHVQNYIHSWLLSPLASPIQEPTTIRHPVSKNVRWGGGGVEGRQFFTDGDW